MVRLAIGSLVLALINAIGVVGHSAAEPVDTFQIPVVFSYADSTGVPRIRALSLWVTPGLESGWTVFRAVDTRQPLDFDSPDASVKWHNLSSGRSGTLWISTSLATPIHAEVGVGQVVAVVSSSRSTLVPGFGAFMAH